MFWNRTDKSKHKITIIIDLKSRTNRTIKVPNVRKWRINEN